MSYSVAYQQRAINEYEEAAAWYRERSVQAAENFEIAVKEKIDILRNDPTRYRKTYQEFREVKLDKYPSVSAGSSQQSFMCRVRPPFYGAGSATCLVQKLKLLVTISLP
jgi:plasmid stabilization system protein ParE